MSASNWVHLDVDFIIRETDGAFLVVIDDDEVWLPKSQVSEAEKYAEGDANVTLSVTRFIAREKGLEGTDD